MTTQTPAQAHAHAQGRGFRLRHDALGRLVFIDAGGSEHVGAIPVRAFPVSAPGQAIALLDAEGHELAWIEQWPDVPPEIRAVIEAELATREFMPEISRIVSVSSFATPSVWQVDTSHGPTALTLKGEEDIRRLPPAALLISDSHGMQFLIRDTKALDRHSRKILDRFL